jgi:Calponin homology (CH) domain
MDLHLAFILDFRENATGMKQEWENSQAKTFTKWINSKIAGKDRSPVESSESVADIFTSLKDGRVLVRLLSILSGCTIKYERRPQSIYQKIENVKAVLDFMEGHGISTTNIGPGDIADGNRKLTLGLVWTIILRFSISSHNNPDFKNAREALLSWCRTRTAPYPEIRISDFSFSWRDGKALAALLHSGRPDLVNLEEMEKRSTAEVFDHVFTAAETHLGIAKLLDVEDITEVSGPEEKSMMTYISQYKNCFMENEEKQRKRDLFEKKRAGVLELKSSLDLLLQEFSRKKEELRLLFVFLREKERELLLSALDTAAEGERLEVESGQRVELSFATTDVVVGISDLLSSTNSLERWERGRSSPISYAQFSYLREASLRVESGTPKEKISYLKALLERREGNKADGSIEGLEKDSLADEHLPLILNSLAARISFLESRESAGESEPIMSDITLQESFHKE